MIGMLSTETVKLEIFLYNSTTLKCYNKDLFNNDDDCL